MLLLIMVMQLLLASENDQGLRERRKVSFIPDLQPCYLWNPYASNQEISRTFGNFCLSRPPLLTPNIIHSLSNTSPSWALPTLMSSAQSSSMPTINFSALPDPPLCALSNLSQSPLPVIGIKPLCAFYEFPPPPLPDDIPRTMDEYVKLIPISM